MSRRIGVFGGTFDPPHRGHVAVARDVAEALGLDEVLWIPAGDPPHKHDPGMTPAPLRLRMVRAATKADERFRVSEIEVGRDGPSYTADTLRALREEVSEDTEIFLIMGVDQYRDLDSWHRPAEVRELATLAVMDRAGESVEGSDLRPREGVVRVPVQRIDISSTRIRAAADRGESIAQLVPPQVARIIEAEGLYRRSQT